MTSPPPLDIGTLTRLWMAGIAAYTHRWSSPLGDLPIDDNGRLTIAGAMWATALAGFSRECVLQAIEAHVQLGDPWPPSLPQFRVCCFGLPSKAAVRAEIAASNTDRSPFTRLVWAQIRDPYAWARDDVTSSERTFREAYQDALEHVLRGNPLPEDVAGLIERQPPPARAPLREVLPAEVAMADLAALFKPAPEEPAPAAMSPPEVEAYEGELRQQAIDRKSAAAGERDQEDELP